MPARLRAASCRFVAFLHDQADSRLTIRDPPDCWSITMTSFGQLVRRLRYGKAIVIVSGLPRSGTSMAMKMLEAGGMPILADGIRTADISNPKGYYEYEPVKELDKGGDVAWLAEARGKAVKIISFLLTWLPETYDYRVIFMQRDLREVLASQNAMLAHRGEAPGAADDRAHAANVRRSSPESGAIHGNSVLLYHVARRLSRRRPEPAGRRRSNKSVPRWYARCGTDGGNRRSGSLPKSQENGGLSASASGRVGVDARAGTGGNGPRRGLHRPRRRICPALVVLRSVHDDRRRDRSLLFWPFRALLRVAQRDDGSARAHQAADRRRPRRPGPEADRSLHAGRPAAELSTAGARRAAIAGFARRSRRVSPVAWSSFSTGTNPARHNIFDFLDRDRRTYLPVLSSTRVGKVRARFSSSAATGFRSASPSCGCCGSSKPFWAILGEHRIWSTILRVPITFPPDNVLRSGAERDVRARSAGHPGDVSAVHDASGRRAGSRRAVFGSPVTLAAIASRRRSQGPENVFVDGEPPLELPLCLALDRAKRIVHADIGRQCTSISSLGRLSDWVTLTFRAAPGIDVTGSVPFARHRDGRALFAVHVADQHRPRATGDADLPPVVLRDLSGQAHRPVLDARTGRRHVGAERRRHRRRHLSAADVRHRSRAASDVLRRARSPAPRQRSSACSTRPTAFSTCSGGISSTGIRRPRARARREHRDAIREAVSSTTTRWSDA